MPRAIFALILCTVSAAGLLGDDRNPMSKDLDAAEVAYREEKARVREEVAKWFGKQEEAVRAAGNKKLVDRLLADRDAFDEAGTFPPNIPKALVTRSDTARRARETSFQTAIKGFTKSKRDELAKQAEDGLREFRFSLSPVGRAVGDAPVRVLNKNSGLGLAIDNGRKEDRSPIWQWQNLDNPNHYWVLIPVEEEYFVLRNENSKTYLSPALKDGVVIHRGDPDTAKELHWKIVPVKGEPDCFLVRSRATSRYLDAYLAVKENSVVKQWTLNGSDGTPNQHWKFEKVDKK